MNNFARLALFFGGSLVALPAIAPAQKSKTPPPVTLQSTPKPLAEPTVDQVRVGDTNVAIAWPAAVIYQREIAVGGKTFPYATLDHYMAATDIPGGYPALKTAYDQIKSKLATARPYRVLVTVHPSSAVFYGQSFAADHALVAHQLQDQIPKSLALFAALLETESGGSIRVQYDVFTDEGDWVHTPDADRNVTTLFTDARASHGANGYDCAFSLVNGGLLADPNTALANGVPLIQVPIIGDSATSNPNDLAETLWWTWHGQDTRRDYAQATPALKPSAFADWLGWRSTKPSATSQILASGSISGVSYSPPDGQPAPLGTSAQWPVEALGGKDLQPGQAYGDYRTSPNDDKSWLVTRASNWVARGGARLLNFEPNSPANQMVTVKVKAPKPAEWALVFRSADGKETFSYGLCPVHPVPSGDEGFIDLPADNQWHEFTLEVPHFSGGLPPASLEMTMTPSSQMLNRRESQEVTAMVAPPVLAPLDATKLTPFSAFHASALLSANPSASHLIAQAADYSSKTDQTRVGILLLDPTKVDAVKVGELLTQAKDFDFGTAYAACQTLGAVKSPEAIAALKKVVELGPYDFNRACALRAINQNNIPIKSDDLWRPLASQDWTTRLAAVQTLAKATDDAKNIVMLTMMLDGEPAVRGEVPAYLDPDDPIAGKRILYFAANDPTEYVRIKCISRMFSAKNPKNRAEAYRSVRDGSVWVATELMSTMNEAWQPEFADAVKLAVLDPRPAVSAAAIALMGLHDGDFQAGDIEPTLSSNDYQVQAALLLLAEKKKGFVPAATLTRISQGSYPDLAARAQKLGSGTK